MKSIIKLLWIVGWLLVGHLAVVDTVSAQLDHLDHEVHIHLPIIITGESSGVSGELLNKWRGDIQQSVNRIECFWVNKSSFGAEASSGVENPIVALSNDIIDVVDEKYVHSRVSQILVCPPRANSSDQHIVSVILTVPDPVWTASYYSGREFSNVRAISKFKDISNLNWGGRRPINQLGIRADDFSIVFERIILFTGQNYEFEAQADDCVRVSLDALNDGIEKYDLIIDGWHERNGLSARCDIDRVYRHNAVLDGLYKVRVEYYEGGGNASLKFRYREFQYWDASYFNNRELFGTPVFQRQEPIKSQQLDHVWDENSPGNGIGRDRWSAQWEGRFSFDAGEYEFWTESDDGVRVFLDNDKNNPIFDKWTEGGDKKFCEKRSIDAGFHQVNVDYYENRGKAKIKVWWKPHIKSTTIESLCLPNNETCLEEQMDRCEDYRA